MSKEDKLNFDLLPESASLLDVINKVNTILLWKREEDIASLEAWQEAFKEAERIREGVDIYEE